MTDPVNRRRVLGAGGAVGLGALLAACSGDPAATTTTTVPTSGGGTATVAPQTSTPSDLGDMFSDVPTCALTPQETEGPYYFDVDSIRGDIREDRPGVPLRLAIRVLDAACLPLPNAVVDIWHCDAGGLYSGFESASRGGAGGGRTDEETYLRGAQVTNGEGIAQFTTIYPGWYQGRTVHIHLKVHLDRRTTLTSQLYFDDAVSEKVFAREPYTAHGRRDRFNRDDGGFDEGLVLSLREDGAGYLGVMSVNVAP